MTRPHDPTGAGKLKQFVYSAWIMWRNSQDDAELKPGETRPPDRVLQLSGLRLEVAGERGAPVIVDESGIPVPILEFIERAHRERRRIYGCLIATEED